MALGDRRARVRLEVVGALWATLDMCAACPARTNQSVILSASSSCRFPQHSRALPTGHKRNCETAPSRLPPRRGKSSLLSVLAQIQPDFLRDFLAHIADENARATH